MKATKLAVVLLATMGISAVVTPAMAYNAGDWLVRGRIAHIDPNDDSGTLNTQAFGDIGEGVTVDSDTIPELDITYMITQNWGVELILGYSEHTVTTHKGAGDAVAGFGDRDVIDTKVLPPTLLLQYHFRPNAKVQPYFGAGVNYTYFWDEDVPSDSGVYTSNAKVDLEDSWGLALQIGMDIAISENWFVNMDVKWIEMDTTAKFKETAVGWAEIDADINPFVYGIGIGRRF